MFSAIIEKGIRKKEIDYEIFINVTSSCWIDRVVAIVDVLRHSLAIPNHAAVGVDVTKTSPTERRVRPRFQCWSHPLGGLAGNQTSSSYAGTLKRESQKIGRVGR